MLTWHAATITATNKLDDALIHILAPCSLLSSPAHGRVREWSERGGQSRPRTVADGNAHLHMNRVHRFPFAPAELLNPHSSSAGSTPHSALSPVWSRPRTIYAPSDPDDADSVGASSTTRAGGCSAAFHHAITALYDPVRRLSYLCLQSLPFLPSRGSVLRKPTLPRIVLKSSGPSSNPANTE